MTRTTFLHRLPHRLPLPTPLLRSPALHHNHHRTLTTTPRASNGSDSSTHVTNKKDELDVHSAASKSGKRDRASDNTQSGAASERDARDDNKRAKEENPEAPGPVIGMNDERGGVSC